MTIHIMNVGDLKINDHEIAVIGSTFELTFDVTDPQNSTEVSFVHWSIYDLTGVIHRDYHDYNGYLYAWFVMKETQVHYKLLIFQIYQMLQQFMIQIHYFKSLIIFLLILILRNYMAFVKHVNPTSYTMDIYSLSNPTLPNLIYTYDEVGHVHDAYVRNDTLFKLW